MPQPSDETCAHWWITDREGNGTCKLCGEKKQFHNTLSSFQISTATNKLRNDREYWHGRVK